MGQLDEAEYARLETQVREIEKLVNSGAPGDAGVLLRNFLSNAKSRMEEIRQDQGMDGESKKDRREREAAMAVQLAEMEHRLSAGEKQRYSGFMELEYFRKADFEELEEFYSNSWDRLSEGGKNQMSVRVWGGIRRHEYSFDELPEKMREKESERIYQQLTGAIEPSAGIRNVPPQSKADFVREYEAGNEKATTKILSGDGFAAYSPDTLKASSVKADAFTKEQRTEDETLKSKLKSGQGLSLSGLTLGESEEINVPSPQAANTARPAQKS